MNQLAILAEGVMVMIAKKYAIYATLHYSGLHCTEL